MVTQNFSCHYYRNFVQKSVENIRLLTLQGKKVNSKLSESPEFIFIVLAQQVF